MGKRKLEVKNTEDKKTEDKKKQRDTFEARQRGLFKKARQLGQLYDAGIALITISEDGKISEYGSPSLDSVLQRYQEAKNEAAAEASNDVQPQAQNLPEHDADEIEESPVPDDDDQNTSHQEIKDYSEMMKKPGCLIADPKKSFLAMNSCRLEMELKELKELRMQIEEKKKVVLDLANEIKKNTMER